MCGYDYEAKLVAVVHDELVVELSRDGRGSLSELMADSMLWAAKSVLKRVDVPMPDVHIGKCWEH
jgi:DNA polymerase I-like protein with 3'-5' exonuclease and polymerase domains